MENDISLSISALHSDASPPNILSLHRCTRYLLRIFSNRRAECILLNAPVQYCVPNWNEGA